MLNLLPQRNNDRYVTREDLNRILEQISKIKKGEKGSDAYVSEALVKALVKEVTPTKEQLQAVIKPLIPAPIAGSDGKDGKDGNTITSDEIVSKIRSHKGKERLIVDNIKGMKKYISKINELTTGYNGLTEGYTQFTDSLAQGNEDLLFIKKRIDAIQIDIAQSSIDVHLTGTELVGTDLVSTLTDGTVITTDLSSLDNTSVITNTITGNTIATHDDGNGNLVDINETVTSLTINANILSYVKEDGTTDTIDLSLYLDDTNLARIVSGVLDGNTGIATFTRDDATTFTLDLSNLIVDPTLIGTSVNQTGHGLVVGDVIKSSGVDYEFDKALADNEVNAEVVGIVTNVIDADNFEYAKDIIDYTGPGIPSGTPGQSIWLSETTPGAMTLIQPTGMTDIRKPIGWLIADGTSINFTSDMRGELPGTAGTGAGSTTLTSTDGSVTLTSIVDGYDLSVSPDTNTYVVSGALVSGNNTLRLTRNDAVNVDVDVTALNLNTTYTGDEGISLNGSKFELGYTSQAAAFADRVNNNRVIHMNTGFGTGSSIEITKGLFASTSTLTNNSVSIFSTNSQLNSSIALGGSGHILSGNSMSLNGVNHSVTSGVSNIALGGSGHIFNAATTASGTHPVALGGINNVFNEYGIISGSSNVLDHAASSLHGAGLITSRNGDFVVGVFNDATIQSRFTVGIGGSTSSRLNGFVVGTSGDVYMPNIGTYADNAAALGGGEIVGSIYKTPTGELRIVV